MNNQAVHCENIVKIFGSGEGEIFALRGVTLSIQKGELLMIAGPSGCGKTTFVSILTAMLGFTKGSCEVLGQDIKTMSEEEKVTFRGKRIGFVFQNFNLLPALSAVENVALPLLVNGVSKEVALKKAKEMLNAVGLTKYETKPKNLSGGQQQKVAIARALVHEPQLVVCDEPTSSLDHASGEMIMQLLSQINREKGVTMIVVTHDNRIYKYATRMAYMEDGRIIKVEEH